MKVPSFTSGSVDASVSAMLVSGAAASAVGAGNQISSDWINVDLKESDMAADLAGSITPPPITGH